MTIVQIERPDVDFDAVEHVYSIAGEKVAGVSSVAKLGGADDAFGIASAWGYRIGYEGAWDVLQEVSSVMDLGSADDLRAELKRRKLTPWDTRDAAADRGTAVHDALEELAQNDAVPDPMAHPESERGHVMSVLKFVAVYRPRFVATEVQVASRTHLFAGRYDLRILVPAVRLLPLVRGHESPQADRIRELAARRALALCLADLKTSKRIYPETHFPQLSGYELAGVEMGFPATDCQIVLNTNEDGSFDPEKDVAVSWSQPEDFVDLLAAYRAIRRLKAGDPEERLKRAREQIILANLPAKSRDLVALGLPELEGLDGKAVGRILGGLRKRGLALQEEVTKVWEVPPGRAA